MSGYQKIIVWTIAAVFSLLVIGSTVGTLYFLASQTRVQNERRHDSCISRQNLYDGQLVMVHFLAGQFHATKAQEAAGTAVLVKTLGPRPEC